MPLQEHQITHPGLEPITGIHLGFLRKVVDVDDILFLIGLSVDMLLRDRCFHVKQGLS
jgi:hypothetical protein